MSIYYSAVALPGRFKKLDREGRDPVRQPIVICRSRNYRFLMSNDPESRLQNGQGADGVWAYWNGRGESADSGTGLQPKEGDFAADLLQVQPTVIISSI
jgi:hypothetical protein